MNDLLRLSACEIVQQVRSRKVSVTDITHAHLNKVHAHNGELNALTEVLEVEALVRARHLDDDIAKGRISDDQTLLGVPVTTKINADQLGQVNSNGVVAFKDNICDDDAAVVANLRKAGAVVIGRTNTPEFSMRWFTSNPLYGETKNPWNGKITPGGSSGGAAAAVASSMGVLAHGNDLGGSLRYPAYCCGVTSIRPSLGRVPAYNPSASIERPYITQLMSVQGPIGRCVDDVALGLASMASKQIQDPLQRAFEDHETDGAQRKIGYCIDLFGNDVSDHARRSVEIAVRALRDAGHLVFEVMPPNAARIAELWGELLLTEIDETMGANLRQVGSKELNAVVDSLRGEFRQLDIQGLLNALSERLTHQRTWARAFKDYDALVLPVSASPPFQAELDFIRPESVPALHKAQRFLTIFNLLGLPSVAVPTHIDNAVPGGVQIVGPMGHDFALLEVARDLEKSVGIFVPKIETPINRKQVMNSSMMHKQLTIDSLVDHAARYHSQTEIVSLETNGDIGRTNWGEVANNSKKLASALGKLGLKQGDRAATIAWNNSRHLEIYFGVAGGGMVCHTINPRLFPEQLIFIINHAEDQVLFVDRTFLPIAVKLREHLKTLKAVVLMGPRDEAAANEYDGLMFYDELIKTGDDNYDWPELEETTPSSLCYTSGTTGNPKGVLYTHRSTVLHALGGNQPDGIAISASDTVMPVVPMFHVNAWGVPYIASSVGCKLVLPGPGLDGASLVKLIDGEKVTLALGVPTIWQGLLAALKETGSKAKSLKRTVVGGSALPPSMIPEFRDTYGVDLIHAWGMTETSPLGTLNQLLQKHSNLSTAEQADIRLGQGRPPFGVELRLLGEDGVVLPNDGESQGDLQIRGHWIADSYFQMGESALTDDGWFDTGDVATIDPDGYMIIRDRSKDIIKSGGEWISTVELENIAISHKAVANAAVIAGKHKKWDERPILIAVMADGHALKKEALLAHYKGKIADWQIPDKVVFVDELPIGGTGKVLKNKLREQYGDLLLKE